METTRRALLRMALTTSGAFFLPPWLSRVAHAAQRVPDRYFVFAYFSGGWDILLGLDPRDPDEFNDDNLGQTQIQPGYSRLQVYGYPTGLVTGTPAPGRAPLVFGPAIGELASVANELVVFNGVNMSTLTHEVGRRYFLTGRTPAGLQARGSSIAAEVAAQIGDSTPVPNLAHTVETYAEGLPRFAGAVRINQLSDLLLALRPSPTVLPAAVEGALESRDLAPLACAPEAYDAAGLLTQYRQSRLAARQMVKSGVSNLFSFNANTPEIVTLRQRFGITNVDGSAGQAALAAQAIRNGVSQVVSVELANGLDTHFNNWAFDHPRLLSTGFNALARLIAELKASPHPSGGNYLDRTLICAFSEFARTPLLNDRAGRDHFLGNSCVLAGGGLKKGVRFGESSNYAMSPRLVSNTTGQPSPTGVSLTPEHVLATMLAAARLDYSFLRVEPIADALM